MTFIFLLLFYTQGVVVYIISGKFLFKMNNLDNLELAISSKQTVVGIYMDICKQNIKLKVKMDL